MNKEEQKYKDANYVKHDIAIAKDMEGILKLNGINFKVTILRMVRYMAPPLRVAKDCFNEAYKPGCTFAEIIINGGELK